MNQYVSASINVGTNTRGAAFVDGHVAYLGVTRDKPDYQRGFGWSFVYNDL